MPRVLKAGVWEALSASQTSNPSKKNPFVTLADIGQSLPVAAGTTYDICNFSDAPSTVDGVSLKKGDRVLVLSQHNASENGLYRVLSVVGDNVWVRDASANLSAEFSAPVIYKIASGDVLGGTEWLMVTTGVTLGTNAIRFVRVDNKAFAGSLKWHAWEIVGTYSQFVNDTSSVTITVHSGKLPYIVHDVFGYTVGEWSVSGGSNPTAAVGNTCNNEAYLVPTAIACAHNSFGTAATEKGNSIPSTEVDTGDGGVIYVRPQSPSISHDDLTVTLALGSGTFGDGDVTNLSCHARIRIYALMSEPAVDAVID